MPTIVVCSSLPELVKSGCTVNNGYIVFLRCVSLI